MFNSHSSPAEQHRTWWQSDACGSLSATTVGCLGMDVVDRHFKRVKEITSLNNTVMFSGCSWVTGPPTVSLDEVENDVCMQMKWFECGFLVFEHLVVSWWLRGQRLWSLSEVLPHGVDAWKWDFKLHNPPCFLIVLGSELWPQHPHHCPFLQAWILLPNCKLE